MYSVLLVDDEPIVKITLRRMIDWEKYGFFVCGTASDGNEGVFMAKKLQPDIIITDLKMPNMDGLQLIEKLKELDFKGCILVLSNYSDYEYVRQALKLGAVDYILKISLDKDELLSLLSQCVSYIKPQYKKKNEPSVQIQEIIIRNYLTDALYSYEELCLHLGKEDLNEYSLCYISQPGQNKLVNRNGKEILPESFKTILSESFAYISENRVIQLNLNSFCILISKKKLENINLTIRDFAYQLQQFTMRFLAMSFFIMISEKTYTFKNLKNWFLEIQDKEGITFYDLTSPVCMDDIILQSYINFTDYRTFSAELINEYISKGIYKNIGAFDKFIDKCIKESINPIIIKSYFEHLCQYCAIIVATDESECISILNQCQNIHQMKDALYNFFEKINTVLQKSKVVYREEVAKCIQYIHAHYQEEITLDMLSKKIGISKSYLCATFKTDVHTSIIQYINDYRMEQAVMLMQGQEQQMKKIAESVGFSDQFYFNRLFKKKYGMTPSEYKTQKNQKSNL